MKNRMGVPQEYEPKLPKVVKAYIEQKKAQAAGESPLTQLATAVGHVIGQFHIYHKQPFTRNMPFNVKDLTTEEFRELQSACVNHLAEFFPGIEKETID